MLDTETKEIDGYTYTSTKLPAMAAHALLARCITAAGSTGMQAFVARYAAGFAEVAPLLVPGARGVNLYGALLQLSHGVEQDPNLPRDLCASLMVDKLRPANMGGGKVGPMADTHFAGELPHMWAVLEFVAVHNFLGFTLGQSFPIGAPAPAETPKGESSD